MKVGLLECDHVLERFRHIGGDYRDMFATLFAPHAPSISLHPFDVCNGEFPASIDECAAYVCTGSRFSVYDDVAWIHTLKDFIWQLRDAEQPFVGICFGHQMLAEALGGKVTKSEYGWGAGVHSVELVKQEAWMQPPQTRCHLQYMHQDQVQQLPDNSTLLGQSAHCPVAIFQVGATMLGIQAHPEFPAAYSDALLLDRVERIGVERVQTARGSLSQKTDEALVANWIACFLSQYWLIDVLSPRQEKAPAQPS
jgi:GMP synthase-like glutamine amidotransferase